MSTAYPRYKINNKRGFIQIPILIITILGVLGISTGGYFIAETISNNKKEQIVETTTTDLLEEDKSDLLTSSSTDGHLEDKKPVNFDNNLELDNPKPKISLDNFLKTNHKSEIENIDKVINNLSKLLEDLENAKISSIKSAVETNRQRSENFKDLAKDFYSGSAKDYLLDMADFFEEESKNTEKTYSNLFSPLDTEIRDYLSELVSVRKDLLNNNLTQENEVFLSLLVQKNNNFFDMTDFLVKEMEEMEERKYDLYLETYQKTSLLLKNESSNNNYLTFQDINSYLDNLPPLETNTSNCQYPKDKYILIPNKGWTEVKECSDGSYIEASKYKYDNSSLTPEQQCAQRKAGALANNIGGKVDCSDLGL